MIFAHRRVPLPTNRGGNSCEHDRRWGTVTIGAAGMTESSRHPTPFNGTLRDLWARAGLPTPNGVVIPDVRITSLTDDSRTVTPGACFVAVRGATVDGHAFVGRAARAGAAALIVDRDAAMTKNVPCIKVEDTRTAVARLAAAWYGLRDATAAEPMAPRLVGITGTNGKTTVAYLIRSMLRAAGKRTAMLGTIEYDLLRQRQPAPLTTPAALDLCRHLAAAHEAGAAYAVLEVSSHALDQRRTDGLHFAAGVFTNLSGDHLDYHGSVEAYAQAKRRLMTSLGPEAVAVVNQDDPAAKLMIADLDAKVVTFGIEDRRADVHASIESMEASGSRFRVAAEGFDEPMATGLIGEHNVKNVLAAVGTALALGVEPDAVHRGVEQCRGIPGRLEPVQPVGCPFTVLVDYAHTDDALNNALRAVRSLTPGRLICVFGCGGDRDRGKRPRMAAAVQQTADVAFVTSDNPRNEQPDAIIADILTGFDSSAPCRIEVDADRRAAIHAAIGLAEPGDTVLIAGKGHENYQIIGEQRRHFDDAEIATECLGDLAVGEGAA